MTHSKTVLITGSSQRLGAAMIKAFHAQGCKVLIHYFQSKSAAETLANELNQLRSDSAFICGGKLSDTRSLAKQVSELTDQLDILINNASSFYPTPVGEITPEHWDDLFESNAKAPLLLTQALLPLLKNATERSGNASSVINMIDIHAQTPLKDHTVYCMAKAANQMMTQSLAKELAPNIRVNGIAPGAILWPDQAGDVSNEYKQQTMEKIPSQRLGQIEEIVETALFLANGPGYITGEIISVDGGRRLYS